MDTGSIKGCPHRKRHGCITECQCLGAKDKVDMTGWKTHDSVTYTPGDLPSATKQWLHAYFKRILWEFEVTSDRYTAWGWFLVQFSSLRLKEDQTDMTFASQSMKIILKREATQANNDPTKACATAWHTCPYHPIKHLATIIKRHL